MADAEARWLVYLRAVSPKEKERYLRPRPKNLSSSNQCLMAAGHSSNPGLFWWQSSGTNRRLLISLICSLTRRSYSRDTSPPLNGHAFGKQRFHNILLCCAEDPSYTNRLPIFDRHLNYFLFTSWNMSAVPLLAGLGAVTSLASSLSMVDLAPLRLFTRSNIFPFLALH